MRLDHYLVEDVLSGVGIALLVFLIVAWTGVDIYALTQLWADQHPWFWFAVLFCTSMGAALSVSR